MAATIQNGDGVTAEELEERKAERRDRRKARAELEAIMLKLATRRLGLFATDGQLRAAAKVLTDRFYKEQISPAARRIEDQVILEAAERARSIPVGQ